MGENIIEQVQNIEAEADTLVADARESAREMARSTEERISDLREQHQEQLRKDVQEMEEEVEEQTRKRIEEIETAARRAEQHLDSLSDETMNRAVDFIVTHLREED